MHIPKRHADWRMGRWTAKQAAAFFLNLPSDISSLDDIEIRAASSGAPEIFLCDREAPAAISLSHTASTALCTIAAPDTCFGCDLETIEPRDAAFVADYFTPEEQSLIAASPAPDRPLILAVLWSAKESALKALRAGLRLPTTSVSVSLNNQWRSSLDRREPNFSGQEEWFPLSARGPAGQIFRGYWLRQSNLVRTVVSAAPHFNLHEICIPADVARDAILAT
jgi:4'-phosphopantetheinyl transferase